MIAIILDSGKAIAIVVYYYYMKIHSVTVTSLL